jgi:RNA polymerase sigma-70 factor (ECF subfamily)
MSDERPTTIPQTRPAAGAPDREDRALIAAIAAGDEATLRQLYDRDAPWLAVRLRRTLPVSAVEDVLQETFLAVWRGAGSYQGTGELGGWLWGIARRQAALWQRQHGRPEFAFDEAIDHASAMSNDPAHEAVTRIELQRAFAAAGAPGSVGRDLARRVFLDDQPLGDIATDLEIPTGTVKSRVFALRRVMKQVLGKEVEP